MNYIKVLLVIISFLAASCSKDNEDKYTPKDPVTQKRSDKRGVAFNFQFADDVNVLGPSISWSYNWAISQREDYAAEIEQNEIDFCPMAWNGVNATALREYVKRNPNCEYLLAYNEPNLVDQANMTPKQAAAKWGELKSIADELGLKIVSPAMNYGTLENYHDPIVWLDEFFTLVSIDDIDAISLHCYMPNAGAVKWFIERFRKYNKPIWLTEFCAWDGLNSGNFSVEGQQKYASNVLNYLESDPMVERYAWFIPRGNGSEDNFPYMFLLKNSYESELTALGEIYTQLSTQDKNIYYVEQQTIEAEHYSSLSIADGVGADGWVNGPQVRVTTESPNESLELYNFFPNQWVEYQIEIDRTKEFDLELRYASFTDSEISISIDGVPLATHTLASTQEDFIWRTAILPVNLKQGKHTMRITQKKGTFCLNWLRLV